MNIQKIKQTGTYEITTKADVVLISSGIGQTTATLPPVAEGKPVTVIRTQQGTSPLIVQRIVPFQHESIVLNGEQVQALGLVAFQDGYVLTPVDGKPKQWAAARIK